MTQSKEYPTIKKLQGKILVPYNVKQITIQGEDQESIAYEYDQLRMDYPGPFELYQNLIWRRLQSDLQRYVYGNYDPGEQATLTGYAVRATNLGRQDIVDICLPVQAWIDNVLAYYDGKKTEIFTASDMAGVMSVTWDFAGDQPNPNRVDWRDVKEMFND
jgi:hypothetical protein